MNILGRFGVIKICISLFFFQLKYCEFFTLKQLKARNDWNVNYTALPDLTDNSLCRNIAYYYETEYSRGMF